MSNKINPYVGLRPYHTDENSFFFGRETQTLELLQRLYQHRFVAVIGSSGCGKSSLLRAGLIPALKGGFLVEDSNKWMISIMKPGESPLYNLAEALLKEIDKSAKEEAVVDLATQIEEEGIDAILAKIRPLWEKQNFNFFLLVDQFEELFAYAKKKPEDGEKTRADSMNETITLVSILLELSQQNSIPFHAVFTMRSDFIGDCAQYHGLPEAMNKSQYLVPRLSRQELKKVIEGPAKLSGKKFNSSLTSKLQNSLGDVQDELPILQHALMRMWEYDEHKDRDNRDEISFEDYEGIGGLQKALSNHAQEAIDKLSRNEKRIARTLFKALTTIDDNNRKIRRQVRLSKLVKLTETSEKELLDVIDCFNAEGRSFLVKEKIGNSDDTLLDISHESLIRQWRTLRELVVEEAKGAKQYKALSVKRKQYKAGERSLLAGIEYERTQKWWNDFKPNNAWVSQYANDFEYCKEFMNDSKVQYERRKKKEKFRTKVLPRIVAGGIIVGLIVWGSSLYIKKETEAKEIDANLWDKAVKENTIAAYADYLQNSIDDENDSDAQENLNKIHDSLWARAKAINTLDEYDVYIEAVTDSVDNSKNPPERILYEVFKTYNDSVTKAKSKISREGIEETDNPWELAQRGNTVIDYINYIESKPDNYEAAVKKLYSVGTRGWLFCGRTIGNDNTKIALDRVFDIIIRKDSLPFEADAMLRKGDIVRLRGKAHRRIRKTKESTSAGIGIVRDNTKYYVNSVDEDGAVFVEIIF